MEFLVETYRIFELTDWDEYVGLIGTDTKNYNLIVSLGKVDLSDGSVARTLLWDMFPEGTTTGDRFRDVSNGLLPSEDLPEA